MDEEGLRERGSPVVVYLHGLDEEFDWWYCIDVPVTKDPLLTKDDDNSGQPIILPIKKISPVAKLNPVIYGSEEIGPLLVTTSTMLVDPCLMVFLGLFLMKNWLSIA